MRSSGIAVLVLCISPTVRLSAQARAWQSTDYYRLNVVSNPALSPEGRRVAFVLTTVVEDKDRRHNEIWMAPADGSAPAFRYTSPSTDASRPRWAPDVGLLAVWVSRDGRDDDIGCRWAAAPGC